jgi:hypothetical protein
MEDRTVPTPVITIAALSDGHEGGSNGSFRLTRTETTGGLTVNLAPAGGTASSLMDYNFPLSASFAPGIATADVTLTVVNDSMSEPTETMSLGVQGGFGYTVGTPSSATINILDNDPQVVTVANINDAVEGGTSGKFRFTRIGDLSNSLAVNYSVGGTATSGTDYTALSGTVTFAAGAATVDVSVAALTDNAVEENEAVTATVTSGSGYSVGSPSSATVTIADDPPVISVTPLQDGEEGGANASFRITRAGGDVTTSLTVYYTVDGTATSGSDYSALSGSITFAANATTADVTVTVTDDSAPEPDEEIEVIISVDAGYVIGDDDVVDLLITDNETPVVSVQPLYDPLEGAGRVQSGSRAQETRAVL